jgi:hypothetical protein
MSLDRRRVDQHLRRWPAGRCQGMKDVGPDAFGRPAHEAIVERLARTVDARGVDPAATGLQNMNNPADDPAVVYSRLAACIRRKMRFKPRELSVVQPEAISIHRRSPFGALESQNTRFGNPLYGSGPSEIALEMGQICGPLHRTEP